MARGASPRPNGHLLVASHASSVTGRRVADLFERKTCVSGVMLMARGAGAGAALMVALGAIHAHMSVVRKSHFAVARSKSQLGRSRLCFRSSSLRRFLRVASSASLRSNAHLLMASRATSGTGRRVADFLEGKTCVSGVVLVTFGA